MIYTLVFTVSCGKYDRSKIINTDRIEYISFTYSLDSNDRGKIKVDDQKFLAMFLNRVNNWQVACDNDDINTKARFLAIKADVYYSGEPRETIFLNGDKYSGLYFAHGNNFYRDNTLADAILSLLDLDIEFKL